MTTQFSSATAAATSSPTFNENILMSALHAADDGHALLRVLYEFASEFPQVVPSDSD